MDIKTSNLCRLCFDEGNIEIFDENGQQLEIRKIIQQHLDCEASKLTMYILTILLLTL